jgi:hypothetical protein
VWGKRIKREKASLKECVSPTLFDVQKYKEQVQWAEVGCDHDFEVQVANEDAQVPALAPHGAVSASRQKCPFWDTCPPKEDGDCPRGCIPFAQGLQVTKAQRLMLWMGNKAAKVRSAASCPKVCRYVEEDMLNSPKAPGFFVTSVGVLQAKVEKQKAQCSNMLSALNPMCGLRLRKIAALISFVMRHAMKAQEAPTEQACRAAFPAAVGGQLAAAVEAAMNLVDRHKMHLDKTEQTGIAGIKDMLDAFNNENYCGKAVTTKDYKKAVIKNELDSRKTQLEAEALRRSKLIDSSTPIDGDISICSPEVAKTRVKNNWCEVMHMIKNVEGVESVGAKDQNFTLNVTPRAKDLLIDEGFDPIYGARPLRRAKILFSNKRTKCI